MLERLDQQKKLTTNQWKIFVAATVGDMLDFFDCLLIAFVLAFIVKVWHLTYGQSAAILLASGVSAVTAVAIIGPTPGIVISRCAVGSAFERRLISPSS